ARTSADASTANAMAPSQARQSWITLHIATHPAVGGVVRQTALLQVGCPEFAQAVLADGVARRADVDSVDPGGIEAGGLWPVLPGELAVTEAFAQLVGDLKALHQIDDPLRRAPPQAVGTP